MARLPLLPGRRRRDEEGAGGEPAAPPLQRRAIPPPGVLRRERKTLLRVREEALRDLGGLLLEMYRRDTFREELLRDHCADLLDLDGRLQEIDALLAGELPAYAARCACGSPLAFGARFCPSCGLPAAGGAAAACGACGSPLRAEARFCQSCGTAVPAAAAEPPADTEEEPEPEPEPAAANGGDPEASADPWER
jgi:hypothetical protein